jgi:hypothetical protein
MSSQVAKQEIDFEKLINQYKTKTFKSMQTINHEFLFSCIHPTDDDLVIALERNFYPTEL